MANEFRTTDLAILTETFGPPVFVSQDLVDVAHNLGAWSHSGRILMVPKDGAWHVARVEGHGFYVVDLGRKYGGNLRMAILNAIQDEVVIRMNKAREALDWAIKCRETFEEYRIRDQNFRPWVLAWHGDRIVELVSMPDSEIGADRKIFARHLPGIAVSASWIMCQDLRPDEELTAKMQWVHYFNVKGKGELPKELIKGCGVCQEGNPGSWDVAFLGKTRREVRYGVNIERWESFGFKVTLGVERRLH